MHPLDGAHPYVDATSLEHALRHSVDWLASGLMERSAEALRAPVRGELARGRESGAHHLHKSWSNFSHLRAIWSSGGGGGGGGGSDGGGGSGEPSPPSRVLPVFVFSLLGMHPSLLLDRTSLVHSTDDAVIVLQTNNTDLRVPFYAESSASPLGVSTLSPTSHALAGLASSLGALVSPFESFGADGTPAVDFHWAVGNHPFGPFSSASVLPEVMVETARRHATLARLSAASDLLHEAVRAVEALAACYVHPAESGSPMHREQIAMLHDGAPGGYEAAFAHLEEEARGVQHTARHERKHAGHEGDENSFAADAPRRQRVGELLHRLKEGSLLLSSELATTESLRLHAKLLAHEPKLAAASTALAAGEVEAANDLAATLLAASTSTVAIVLDEVRGLEAVLKCCKVEAARPRSYHMRSIGLISMMGIVVWACVLRLTAPAEKRGQSVGVRPGAVRSWRARFGMGGTKLRNLKEF